MLSYNEFAHCNLEANILDCLVKLTHQKRTNDFMMLVKKLRFDCEDWNTIYVTMT